MAIDIVRETAGLVSCPSLHHSKVKPVLLGISGLLNDLFRFEIKTIRFEDFLELKSPLKVENQIIPFHAWNFAVFLKLRHECSRCLFKQVESNVV